MAKARFAKGLRTGSTKSETYSTLMTEKEGRVQIIKDRVVNISNPQSVDQMITRISLATASLAAKGMSELISISTEGVTNLAFAKRRFVSRNAKLLARLANSADTLAAWSPKNNTQIIPNSYIVSEGSLELPAWAQVKTAAEDGASFGDDAFGVLVSPGSLPFGTYTVEKLWKAIFGLNAGDQVTFPQINSSGNIFMAKGSVDSEGVDHIEDLVRYTQFAAPRIVLLSAMPSTELVVDGDTTWADIKAHLLLGIDSSKSYTDLVNGFLSVYTIGAPLNDGFIVNTDGTYSDFSIFRSGADLALGIIISRKGSNGWKYTTTQMVCVYDSSVNSSQYFGYTLDNAIDSYKKVATRSDRNFLQTATINQVLPEDFH